MARGLLSAGCDREFRLPRAKTCVRALRRKVKAESYAWLNAAAIEVNEGWNYANERAIGGTPFAGSSRWLSGLNWIALTAGPPSILTHRLRDDPAGQCRVCVPRNRRGRRSCASGSAGDPRLAPLGTVQAQQLKCRGRAIRFSGKHFRVFEPQRLQGVRLKSGCFAQDAVGDWWLCVAVEQSVSAAAPSKTEVGIDLGLKTTAATSDGEKLEAGHFYRDIEGEVAQAQRRGHKRQASACIGPPSAAAAMRCTSSPTTWSPPTRLFSLAM